MAERSVRVIVDATVSGYISKMRQAEAATRTFASNGAGYVDKHSDHLGKLSNKVGVLGLGLAGLAGYATMAATQWETSWTDVTKTVNATASEFDTLEAGLRGLAKTMPETHAQIAEVAASAGQLGIATSSIVEFTKTMVMLGDSTNLSADEAATSIAQLMNVMHSAPGDVDNLGAALVALGNNGASTERDIIQMAQRIGASGKIVGLSTANVLGLANALASTGVEVEAGGTAISQVLARMAMSVNEGGDALQNWADVAGMSATQFERTWKDKPAEALTSVVEGLHNMDKSGKDVFGTLKTLHLSGIRTTTALLNLANGGDMLRKSLELGDSAWVKNTALVKEAEKRYDTTAAKTKIAANILRDDMISAGQALLPIAARVAETVGKIGEAFGSLPGPVKSSLGVLTGVGGVALLTAAGLIKLAIAVQRTRAEMAALELSGSGSAAMLGRYTKALGYVTAAVIGLRVVGDILAKDSASVASFTAAIVDMGDESKAASRKLDGLFSTGIDVDPFDKGLSSMSKSIKELDTNGFNKKMGQIFGVVGMNPYKGAIDDVNQFDLALTSLVSGGHAEQAAAGFKQFAQAAKDAGVSTSDARDMLPHYADALKNAATESKLAGKSTDDLSTHLQSMVPLTKEARQAIEKAKAATSDAAMSFFDMSKGIDDAKYSFQSWIKGLEDMAKAQAAWADNLILATNRGVSSGVIAQLEKMGPAGAKALDDLAHGTDKDIARVNDAFNSAADTADNLSNVLEGLPPEVITSFKAAGSKDAISTAIEVANKYHLTPTEVRTILRALNYTKKDIDKVIHDMDYVDGLVANPKIKVSSNASRVARDAQSMMNGVQSVNRYIRVARVNADGGVYDAYADGGIRHFAGGSENHVAQIGNGMTRIWDEPETMGEAYIPFAETKRARSLEILAQVAERFGYGLTKAKEQAYQSREFGGAELGPAPSPAPMQAAPSMDARDVKRMVQDVLHGLSFDLGRDNRTLTAKVRGG
jgi:TP901 family phage tail tape measure protein